MNKKKIGAIVSGFFFVAFIVVLVLLLCGVFDSKDNFEATRIELDIQNTQTEFYVGEVFNSDNLIVTVFNEEEESKKVEDFSVDSAEFNSGKIGEYSINVYYQDVFATYKVKVISAEQFLTKILNSEETKAFAQSVTSLSIDQGAKNAEYKVLNDEFYINNGLDSEQWGGKGYIYTRNDENYLMERFDQETFLKSVAGEDFQIEQDWTYVQNLTYAFSVEPLKELQANEVRFDSVVKVGNDYLFSGRRTYDTTEHPYTIKVDAQNHYVKEWAVYSDDKQNVTQKEVYYFNTSISIPPMEADAVWQAVVDVNYDGVVDADDIKTFLLTQKTFDVINKIENVTMQSDGEDYKLFTNQGVYSLTIREDETREEVWQTGSEKIVKTTTVDQNESVERKPSTYKDDLTAIDNFVYNDNWQVAQNYYYHIFFKFLKATEGVQQFAISQEGNLLTVKGGNETLVFDLETSKIVSFTENIYEGTVTFTLTFNEEGVEIPELPKI